jgi:hypothetical protein
MSWLHGDDDTVVRRADGGAETLGELRDEFSAPRECRCRPGSPDACEVCEGRED